MEVRPRCFKTIGYLGVSGEVTSSELATLMSWLQAALKLNVILLVDFNHAKISPPEITSLNVLLTTVKKQGLKFIVVNKDETWGTPKTISDACAVIRSNEAKIAATALTLEDRVIELRTEQQQVDQKLTKILESYGKDMSAIDEMQPDEFLRLNKAIADKHEHLLAVYTECVTVLKSMDHVLSAKETTAEDEKTVSQIKAAVLGFLQQKGVS